MDLDKRVRMCLLFDFYGSLLTDKQQIIMHRYYEEDISLVEIGEELNISRQAVRDALTVSENSLMQFEQKLGFADKHAVIKDMISDIIINVDNSSTNELITKLKNLSDNL